MTKRSVLDMSPSEGQTHEDEILPHEGARESLNSNRGRRKEPDTIISSLPKREGTVSSVHGRERTACGASGFQGNSGTQSEDALPAFPQHR